MTFLQRLHKWLLALCRMLTSEECIRHRAHAQEAAKWIAESQDRVHGRADKLNHALTRLNTSL